jgi:type II secretory pathway pseudopilin PulG
LIVIAIIGILASIVLVSLNSARTKAKDASYISYVSQMTNVVKAAVQAGYFDNLTSTQRGCVGDYSLSSNNCYTGSYNVSNANINSRLQQVSSLPVGQHPANTPDNYGMFIYHTATYVQIYAVVGARNRGVCDKFGWGSYTGSVTTGYSVGSSGDTYHCATRINK